MISSDLKVGTQMNPTKAIIIAVVWISAGVFTIANGEAMVIVPVLAMIVTVAVAASAIKPPKTN